MIVPLQKKLLKQTRVPIQDPYDPNQVSSNARRDKVDNEENNAIEGPNTVDYPVDAQAKDGVYDELEVDNEFEDEDIGDENTDDKFEDDDEDDDEDDEFEDEDIDDKLKNNEK